MSGIVGGAGSRSGVVGQIIGTVGENQTWQDLDSSRAVSTTYTNSTGRTIVISVTVSATNVNNDYFIDGIAVGWSAVVSGVTSFRDTCSLIVPHGSTYKVVGAFWHWFELR